MQLRVWTLLTLYVIKIKHQHISSLLWHSVLILFQLNTLSYVTFGWRKSLVHDRFSSSLKVINWMSSELNWIWRRGKSFGWSNHLWHYLHQKPLIHRLAACTLGPMTALVTALAEGASIMFNQKPSIYCLFICSKYSNLESETALVIEVIDTDVCGKCCLGKE